MMRALRSYLARHHDAASRAALTRNAQERLECMVAERRASFEIQQYRAKRAAALKGRAGA